MKIYVIAGASGTNRGCSGALSEIAFNSNETYTEKSFGNSNNIINYNVVSVADFVTELSNFIKLEAPNNDVVILSGWNITKNISKVYELLGSTPTYIFTREKEGSDYNIKKKFLKNVSQEDFVNICNDQISKINQFISDRNITLNYTTVRSEDTISTSFEPIENESGVTQIAFWNP